VGLITLPPTKSLVHIPSYNDADVVLEDIVTSLDITVKYYQKFLQVKYLYHMERKLLCHVSLNMKATIGY